MWPDLSVAENAARTERMNLYYRLDQRDSPNHKHASTFTGLGAEIAIYEKWKRLLKDHE